ncbi:MAG: hypothetical protein WA085_16215 [Sphingobium sp.]|uniref:hypothetical protein n=1 Tax=Sphingobium sp. CECT 9361 TaxID=2845384 RepID=UPI001E4FE222|nr:hypothetical protein [Sphingobium sp. CECT 9361]
MGAFLTSLIVVKFDAAALSFVETLVHRAADRVPLFGCGHVVVSDSFENMIGNNLPCTSAMNTDKVDGGVNSVLHISHRLRGVRR